MTDRPVTLITGTRKGIGLFLAEHFAAAGHMVVGCSRKATDLVHENYEHYETDVTNESGVKRMFGEIRRRHKRLDHLINNAGIGGMNHAVLTPMSAVDRMLSTNIGGTFLFCREASKMMMQRRYGRIVNFSTVAVPLKLEGEAVYAASKAAVVTLTEVLARELADMGITVNAIGPTPIETDLIAAVPEEKIAKLIRRQAVKRMGTLDDVANVVDFFIRPESNFVTGQILYLGGV